jgi:putative membrane protein
MKRLDLRSKATIIWLLAFLYAVYAVISDVPSLSGMDAFSTVTLSALFVVLYLVHSYAYLGYKRATEFLVVSAVVGYSFEYLFITTGLLGNYVYTANLSPFIGPVPAFIPLLWASLGYFCMLAGGNYVASAVLMMLLDVSFDPNFSTTLWKWVPPGPYFGVPLANFVGWFVTSLVIFGVYFALTRTTHRPTWESFSFYLMVAVFIGSVPDFAAGIPGAGAVSLVLFAGAMAAVYVLARRKGPLLSQLRSGLRE